jgi:hypothetical protein
MRVLHVTERHDFSSGGLTSALNSLMAGMLDTAMKWRCSRSAHGRWCRKACFRMDVRWKGPADFGFGHAAYEGG